MTLQEYLIKLGFSVDEPSLKKFTGAIAGVGGRTMELGRVALETATAIEVMVDRVARHYETLYYVSQRTGQSVKAIQQTQYGFQQIGISADEATDAVEGFAAAIRTQPWLKGAFKFVGNNVQETMKNLQNSGLPYFLQQNLAARVGISEKMLLHYQKFGKIEQEAEQDLKQRQQEAGFNPDELAKKSTDFGRALNRLESEFGIFSGRAAENFIEPLTKGINALTSVAHWLNVADNKTHGWVSTLETLGGTVGALWLVQKVLARIGAALGISGAAAAGGAAAAEGGASAAGGVAAVAGGGLALPLTAVIGTGFAAYWAQKKYGFLGGGGGGNNIESTGSGGGGGASGAPAAILEKARAVALQGGPAAVSAFMAANGYPKSGNWCGEFAASVVSAAGGTPPKNPSIASNWRTWGTATDSPVPGDIAVRRGAPTGATGSHVTIVEGYDPKTGGFTGLGGNQGAFERPFRAGDYDFRHGDGSLADSLSKQTPQGDTDNSRNITLHSQTTVHVHGGADSQTIAGISDSVKDAHQSFIPLVQQNTR